MGIIIFEIVIEQDHEKCKNNGNNRDGMCIIAISAKAKEFDLLVFGI
jgi:hypothetical protein